MQPQASPNRKAADAENCCKCRRRERLGPFDPQGAAALAGFFMHWRLLLLLPLATLPRRQWIRQPQFQSTGQYGFDRSAKFLRRYFGRCDLNDQIVPRSPNRIVDGL